MTRSAGFLIEATGADITLAELTVLLNDGFEELLDRTLPLMPGAARLLAELAAHQVPTALVSASHRRIIDRVLPSLGPENFALTIAGDEVGAHQAAPRPVPVRGRAAGRRPGAMRGHRGHGDRCAAAEAAGCRVVAVPSVAPIAPAAGRTVVDLAGRGRSAISARAGHSNGTDRRY